MASYKKQLNIFKLTLCSSQANGNASGKVIKNKTDINYAHKGDELGRQDNVNISTNIYYSYSYLKDPDTAYSIHNYNVKI